MVKLSINLVVKLNRATCFALPCTTMALLNKMADVSGQSCFPLQDWISNRSREQKT